MTKQIKKRQHYVPQFYLRQFACKIKKDKDYFINSYDKILNMDRVDNVNSVAEEHKYYDIKASELNERFGLKVPEDFDEQELENTFAFWEAEWAGVFRNALERTISFKDSECFPNQFFSEEEKEKLSRFIALQAIRTPSWKKRAENLATFISSNDLFEGIFDDFAYDEYSFYFHIHTGVVDRLARFFLNEFNWIVGHSKTPLVATDSPLAHVVHLKNKTQVPQGDGWPAPPYFEEYSICINPHVILILAQKDNTGFETLIPSVDFELTPRLYQRYLKHHIVSSSRKLFYLNKTELNHLKRIMLSMSNRREDYIDNSKYIVSVP